MIELMINLILIVVIGYVIGHERESKRQVIGIRSITLILLGAFMFTYISVGIGAGDPGRIIAAVPTGIGFIGAGLIFKNGARDIHNLTTAILVWTLSAIGCLIGLSFRIEAILVSLIVVYILKGYKFINKK